MSVLTTCRIADPLGNHLIEVATYSKLDYVLHCAPGAIGVLELELPTSFDAALLMVDGRIGVWRSINGAPPYLDGSAIYLIQTITYRSDKTAVRAYHATQLLERRIIAYYAGSSYTDKTDSADDLIKAFWRQNAGASIVAADRDGVENQADISAYVSVQADLGQGVSVSKAAARRNLLDVARELAEASANEGTYLTFEIVAPTESTLELRTYATARGVDHRSSSASPVVLSEARGNLENAELTIDHRDSISFTIAGGAYEKAQRLIMTAYSDALLARSPFGRSEAFIDSSNTTDLGALQDEAFGALREGRPVTIFTGDLIETPATTRGLHFDLGDMVTAEHPRTRQQIDVRLDMIHETIAGGERKVQCGLRSVTV